MWPKKDIRNAILLQNLWNEIILDLNVLNHIFSLIEM
jgi:hypothetical protein